MLAWLIDSVELQRQIDDGPTDWFIDCLYIHVHFRLVGQQIRKQLDKEYQLLLSKSINRIS